MDHEKGSKERLTKAQFLIFDDGASVDALVLANPKYVAKFLYKAIKVKIKITENREFWQSCLWGWEQIEGKEDCFIFILFLCSNYFC